MDCFAGGGTTLGAAQELGRRWIGADNSTESLSAVIRRFRDGLQDYGDYVSKPFDQPELTLKTETDGTRFSLLRACEDGRSSVNHQISRLKMGPENTPAPFISAKSRNDMSIPV